MNTIEFNGKQYPAFQAEGFAAQFAFPFAKKVCTGVGFDIGCNRKEWKLDGAIPIDLTFNDGYDAMRLPEGVQPNFIFSSHCLEHLPNWVGALNYWTERLQHGGTLFLYLPDYSQEYWRPYNNRKHIHIFEPKIIEGYLYESKKYKNIFISGVDLNNSFMAIAEKI